MRCRDVKSSITPRPITLTCHCVIAIKCNASPYKISHPLLPHHSTINLRNSSKMSEENKMEVDSGDAGRGGGRGGRGGRGRGRGRGGRGRGGPKTCYHCGKVSYVWF